MALTLGDFYIGVDRESFFDLQVHFGKIRIEWNGPKALPKRGRPSTESGNKRTTGKGPCSL